MKLPRIVRALTVLAVCLLVPVSQARAVLEGSFSESEKVGFAFYQLGNLTPHFESWVTSMPKYRKVEPQLRPDFAAAQAERLKDGYEHYDPRTDLIHVRVSGQIRMPSEESRTAAFMKDKKITGRLTIDNFSQKVFPYQVGDNWIGVAPEEIDNLLTFALSEDEVNSLYRKIRAPLSAQMRQIDVEFLLQATEANTKIPATMKGLKVWMMSARVASISVWTRSGEFIWPVYTADWYRPDSKNELLKLYR